MMPSTGEISLHREFDVLVSMYRPVASTSCNCVTDAVESMMNYETYTATRGKAAARNRSEQWKTREPESR